MKKFTILSLALALGLSASAEELTTLSLSAKDIPGAPPEAKVGLMGLTMSRDGKYVAGVLESAIGIFVSDWQNDKITWMLANSEAGGELRGVDNNGVAVGYDGPGISYSFTTGEQTALPVPAGQKGVLGNGISSDGSIMIGSLTSQQGFQSTAVVRKGDGPWELLPIPADDEIAPYYTKFTAMGSGTLGISGDGKVIAGYVGSFAIPMAWIMNDAGEYEPDFFVERFCKTVEEYNNGSTKPLWTATMMAMYSISVSNNGKYVTFRALLGETPTSVKPVPVVYNTVTKEITIYDAEQPIDEGDRGLYPTAICDNGTFIGTIGQPFTGSAGSFVMEKGETVAKTFADVFPKYKEKFGEGDSYGFFVPTGYSATGRYISGYGYYADDYMDAASQEYYLTYIIDRGEDYELSGVNDVVSETADVVPVARYSIDGKLLKAPAQGINIIRMSDGTSRKVMVK